MAVPTENPADCEVRGVTRFLEANEILGYLAEDASSGVELFCCTKLHVRILTGRHKPCCVSNSVRTSSSILPVVRTWQSDIILFPKMKEHLFGKRFANDEDLEYAGWITRRPHGMKRVYTNWCQGTTSTLMSEATVWNSRQRHVPKTCIFSFCIIIKEYLDVVKRSSLYGLPLYNK